MRKALIALFVLACFGLPAVARAQSGRPDDQRKRPPGPIVKEDKKGGERPPPPPPRDDQRPKNKKP